MKKLNSRFLHNNELEVIPEGDDQMDDIISTSRGGTNTKNFDELEVQSTNSLSESN